MIGQDNIRLLLESSFGNSYSQMMFLNEATNNKINNELLLKLYTAISEKINHVDFKEVDKSKGSFKKFKYRNTILSNYETLYEIYETDPAMNTMQDYLFYIKEIWEKLDLHEDTITQRYDDSIISILYISTVNLIIQCMTLLSSATLTFVNSGSDNEEDVEVIMEALPRAEKSMFLDNLKKMRDFWVDDSLLFLSEYNRNTVKKINESFSMGSCNIESTYLLESLEAAIIGVALVPALIYLLFKLGVIIRECIYLHLNTRMAIGKNLDMQIDLLNANIEALRNKQISANSKDAKKNTKIIAKQRWIVDKLQKIRNFLLNRFEDSEKVTANEIKAENKELGLDSVDTSEVLI